MLSISFVCACGDLFRFNLTLSLSTAIQPGNTVLIHNCFDAIGDPLKLDLRLPDGGAIANDPGVPGGSCISHHISGSLEGAVIEYTLACDHQPHWPIPNPSDPPGTWLRLAQNCVDAGTICSGQANITITNHATCDYAAAPPPPPPTPFCGEYEAVGTNDARDQFHSVHCPIGGPGNPANFRPGYKYRVDFGCDQTVTPMIGYPWFQLLDATGEYFSGEQTSYTPCGGGSGTYTRFAFTIPCYVPPDYSWDLLRGCRANEYCKATPIIYVDPDWSPTCAPPPPPRLASQSRVRRAALGAVEAA